MAVDNLSLHIMPGEIYGFIGHNGAGKTTTIKACTGILNFEEGDILIDGVSIKEKPLECKKQMAYIPDNPDMYDFMTGIGYMNFIEDIIDVQEFVLVLFFVFFFMTGIGYLNFIADIFDVPEEVRDELIDKYADAFEIKDNLGQLISEYSHGMKQKLAIISAWIHEPKLVIMDEPLVGLDPKASHILKQMMRKMCDDGGAIFFSTHVLEVAEKLCDKVAIIKGGRLVKAGIMEQVKGDESLESVFLDLEGES